jgi:hypothetical protein
VHESHLHDSGCYSFRCPEPTSRIRRLQAATSAIACDLKEAVYLDVLEIEEALRATMLPWDEDPPDEEVPA